MYQSIYPEFARFLANKNHVQAKSLAIKISLYAGLAFYILLGEWAL